METLRDRLHKVADRIGNFAGASTVKLCTTGQAPGSTTGDSALATVLAADIQPRASRLRGMLRVEATAAGAFVTQHATSSRSGAGVARAGSTAVVSSLAAYSEPPGIAVFVSSLGGALDLKRVHPAAVEPRDDIVLDTFSASRASAADIGDAVPSRWSASRGAALPAVASFDSVPGCAVGAANSAHAALAQLRLHANVGVAAPAAVNARDSSANSLASAAEHRSVSDVDALAANAGTTLDTTRSEEGGTARSAALSASGALLSRHDTPPGADMSSPGTPVGLSLDTSTSSHGSSSGAGASAPAPSFYFSGSLASAVATGSTSGGLAAAVTALHAAASLPPSSSAASLPGVPAALAASSASRFGPLKKVGRLADGSSDAPVPPPAPAAVRPPAAVVSPSTADSGALLRTALLRHAPATSVTTAASVASPTTEQAAAPASSAVSKPGAPPAAVNRLLMRAGLGSIVRTTSFSGTASAAHMRERGHHAVPGTVAVGTANDAASLHQLHQSDVTALHSRDAAGAAIGSGGGFGQALGQGLPLRRMASLHTDRTPGMTPVGGTPTSTTTPAAGAAPPVQESPTSDPGAGDAFKVAPPTRPQGSPVEASSTPRHAFGAAAAGDLQAALSVAGSGSSRFDQLFMRYFTSQVDQHIRDWKVREPQATGSN